MTSNFMNILKTRPLIIDGAMGSMLLEKRIISEHCNEELNLSRPDAIAEIHKEYVKAGADIITTNTFGASRLALSDHSLSNKVKDINDAAVKIARRVADGASPRRFVAGDIGPTSKLPTLAHISFDELFESYREQIGALVNRIDLLLIETCQDPLQIKAALIAAKTAFKDKMRCVPILASVTMEKTGNMLLGTGLPSVYTTILPNGPSAFGINCATGPGDMEEHLQHLCHASNLPIICQPNAGIPEIEMGRARYTMGPDEFGELLGEYAKRFGLSFVGGCCGTTPDHIAKLVESVERTKAKPIEWHVGMKPRVSSLYTSVDLDQEPKPFLVAEQTNVNGSRKFRDLLSSNDFDAMADVAKRASASSHALDICLATPGRDESKDFERLLSVVCTKVDSAIMIDSTNPEVMETALKLMPGRAIINSVNLEGGLLKASKGFQLAKKYGAVVVALTIDEVGMAKTALKKLQITERLIQMAESEGFNLDDLFIDPLTFTLASGEKTFKDAGIQTLKAISEIKMRMKGVRTILGVSNISFGLPPRARKILTSVFLSRALDCGLDAAIINPVRILPLDRIPDDIKEICTRLIDNDDSKGDPISQLIRSLGDMPSREESTISEERSRTPEENLRCRIMEGSKEGLDALIGDVVKRVEPSRVINEILLSAMKEVGENFGKGKLPLPFVLESAEAMRAAIDLVTPHMKNEERRAKGTIVIATVRGDVHDIGKDLVEAILSNNGYNVINLGIRQPAAAIIEAVQKHNADAIGLSGLLVSSTEVMREDLITFKDHGISIPVLLGGAALTESFVNAVLKPAYDAPVYYCSDVFAGFKAMEEILDI